MKILLDECIPKDFCKSFSGYECHTAHRAGLGGLTNGDLLVRAEHAGFDVLITVDKNILYQQNLTSRRIALIILDARSNRLPDLLPHVPECLRILRSLKHGQTIRLSL